MPFRVLSIDGGGIRGLVPAVVLARLEHLAGRPTHELFDLVVGTSTGGILACGLTVPGPGGRPRYAAAELADHYLEDGPRIFRRSLTHRARTANGLLGPRYRAGRLERVLGSRFGDVRLSELLGDVLVTAYETEIRSPWFFRSRRARTDAGHDFRVADAARATAAAPTYFPPARITGVDGRRWSLLDGGVVANNPVMVGVAEAIGAYDTRDVLTVSLGTGVQAAPLPYDRIRGWGLARWARPILDVVLDGQAGVVDHQATRLATSTVEVEGHTRLQVDLRGASDAIDDAGPANLAALRRLADDLVAERDDELHRLAEVLTA